MKRKLHSQRILKSGDNTVVWYIKEERLPNKLAFCAKKPQEWCSERCATCTEFEKIYSTERKSP